jgi:hypothetical protein
MKITIYIDDVNQSIDNAMQRQVVSNLSNQLAIENELEIIDPLVIGRDSARKILIDQKYDILLTYNKTGADLTLPGSGLNLMKSLEKPQVSWLVEHPVTFFDQYSASDSLNKHYILPNINQSLFIKDMGMEGTCSDMMFSASVKNKKVKSSKRDFDICIAAQWRGPADVNEFWTRGSEVERDFFDKVNLLQHLGESGDVYSAFVAAAEYYGVDLNNKKDYWLYLKALYWHARKTERIKMVQDLVASGLKVLLIGGDDWKQVLPKYDNVTFLSSCTPSELVEHYFNSRAVAATNCFNGANERTFEAISCGAVSISENSPTLSKYFNHNESIIFYDRLWLSSNIDYMVDLLKNDKKIESLNDSANRIFLESHTWNHRAKSLVEVISKKISSNDSRDNLRIENEFKLSMAEIKKSTFIDRETPVLYQSYVGGDQRKIVSSECTPFDAGFNNSKDQREYKLFQYLHAELNAKKDYWGLISWSFKLKTMITEGEFLSFACEKIKNGYDCVFINPMIGNEAVFANVWEQSDVVHPGMNLISNFSDINNDLDVKGVYGKSEFAFCNYFIANNVFWTSYLKFVDDIIFKIENQANLNKEFNDVWTGSAQYPKNKNLTIKPFFIERLFSSFLRKKNSFKIAGYDYGLDAYERKFGDGLGGILFKATQLKMKAKNSSLNSDLVVWNKYRTEIINEGLLRTIFKLDDPSNFSSLL